MKPVTVLGVGAEALESAACSRAASIENDPRRGNRSRIRTYPMTEPLSLERFQRLLAAYGARHELWPAAERPAAERLLEMSSEARTLLLREEDLDTGLSALAALTPELTPGLSRKLAELPLRNARKRWSWPFGRVWVPAAAWAAAAVFGIAIGTLTSEGEPANSELALETAQPPSEELLVDAANDEMTELALGSLYGFEETP